MYEKITLNTILIEITNTCNLNCKHCYNVDQRQTSHNGSFMSIEQIKSILDKCQPYSVNRVYLSGGEPLLHPNLNEILELCENYPNILFIITTNALLLTKQLIEELEKHTNISLQISVDGITKKVYESQRGEATFDTFMYNLNNVINSKIKYLSSRTCITKNNYKEVPEIYRYMYDNKISPSFLFVYNLGNAKKNWEDLCLSIPQMLSTLNHINELNNKYNYYVTPPDPSCSCTFTSKQELQGLLIKFDGNIAPCQFFYSESLGNVFEKNIYEIMCYENIKLYYDIAEKRQKALTQTETCRKCPIFNICGLGCVGMANDIGDVLGHDGICKYRRYTVTSYMNNFISKSNPELKDRNLNNTYSGD